MQKATFIVNEDIGFSTTAICRIQPDGTYKRYAWGLDKNSAIRVCAALNADASLNPFAWDPSMSTINSVRDKFNR